MPIPDIRSAFDLLERERPGEAIQILEALVSQLPAYAAAYVLLAQAYGETQQWGKALRSWQRARTLMPNSPAVDAGLRQTLQVVAEVTDTDATFVAATPERPGRSAPLERPQEDRPPASWDPFEGEARPAPDTLEESRSADLDAIEDLDRLIEELETARIEPRPDLDDLPTPDLEDEIEDMVSETLARIYAVQEQYGEAAKVYDKLVLQHPDRADEFQQKADEMRGRAADAGL